MVQLSDDDDDDGDDDNDDDIDDDYDDDYRDAYDDDDDDDDDDDAANHDNHNQHQNDPFCTAHTYAGKTLLTRCMHRIAGSLLRGSQGGGQVHIRTLPHLPTLRPETAAATRWQ
eukprot:1441097-Amphidinium_carterae.1